MKCSPFRVRVDNKDKSLTFVPAETYDEAKKEQEVFLQDEENEPKFSQIEILYRVDFYTYKYKKYEVI